MPTYTRLLSDNELSYFLPSRQHGINDMSVNVAFRAPAAFVTPFRVATVWAILRLRHPLLACQVGMDAGAYDSAHFSYTSPSSPSQAIDEARNNSAMLSDITATDLIAEFVNGPRLLSNQRLCCIYIIEGPEKPAEVRSYDMIILITHFLGDGAAIHQLGHLFFTLIGGLAGPGGTTRTDAQLMNLLEAEWTDRWGTASTRDDVLPASAETMLPSPLTSFQRAVAKVDFKTSQARFIGGHAFPRVRAPTRKIATPNMIFDSTKTRAILAKCKSEGVTVSNAMFVICNFAWVRTRRTSPSQQQVEAEALPMMMYTAISLRPYLAHTPSQSQIPASFFYLAITYCNIVLPSFIPSTSAPSSVFWHRARQVKSQSLKYICSPMFASRTQLLVTERAGRARTFAKEDDAILGSSASPAPPPIVPGTSPSLPSAVAPPVPSVALLGLSQLGNLDYFYPASSYPSITLTRAVSHSRRSKGGTLIFTHTFRGELYLMAEWDQAGLQPGAVEEFWAEVVGGVEEFLVGNGVGAKL